MCVLVCVIWYCFREYVGYLVFGHSFSIHIFSVAVVLCWFVYCWFGWGLELYVRTYVCMYIRTYVRTYIQLQPPMYIPYVRMYIRICALGQLISTLFCCSTTRQGTTIMCHGEAQHCKNWQLSTINWWAMEGFWLGRRSTKPLTWATSE